MLLEFLFPVVKGDVRAEIAQLFKYNPLFRSFIILGLYLQHMESLTEITGRQAISAQTFPFNIPLQEYIFFATDFFESGMSVRVVEKCIFSLENTFFQPFGRKMHFL
ncbi:unnamed protein product [marine sediment metagenome]|uniref:Uncharacterized protein n=1 Tax=marine sediment metagenome TaxID=412755 RepID=X0RUI4_9ZZZZ